ncbi:LuxR C-terminal-related transcriptional regulator [Paraconexibacter sp.]|uniref:LuxR C-terminal-related transcriptional regulator n=1 Tax=Paraconexibacter sp. TaxID=2949640 RepID=UPI00356B139F
MPTAENWTPKGPPISDARIRERLADVLARAVGVLPSVAEEAPAFPRDIDDALSTLDGLIALVRELPCEIAERGDLLGDLREVHGDLREHRALGRYAAMAGIQKALARLRGITSTDEMLQRVPGELCAGVGFDRAIISRVEDSMWIPVKIHVNGDEQWANEILAAASEPQQLDHMVVESEMARRRAPLLVRDVQESDHVHQPIASVSDSRSYVAAPIMPEGHVIGFLHADYYLSQRHPDEFDRDVLFAFAEAFGYVFLRAVLAQRLKAQGEQVRAMASSLEAVIDEIRESEVRMTGESHPVPEGGPRLAPPSPGDHRLHSLLTARELEVIALLAAGETNAAIGARLVISEGTVKSHVKHILRKLRAANRAEAVSKYMRLSGRAA